MIKSRKVICIIAFLFCVCNFSIAQYNNLSKEELLLLQKKIQESNRQKNNEVVRPISKLPKDSVSEKSKFSPTKKSKVIFGFDFFNTKSLSFQPSITVPVTDDYILGYGDEIFINIYGFSQQTYILRVERNGVIIIPSVGPIFIRGLSLKEARDLIKAKLRSIYQGMRSKVPNTFTNISLGDLKSINVNVIGEVNVPGTYTLSAGSFAFSALYLAGGPNENGSFRKIDVIRNGKVIHSIDVYKYIIDGNNLENIQLRNQDVLLVRPYINRINLKGEFKRTGIFESKKGESLETIIRYAGGFTEDAYTYQLKLIRNSPYKTKIFRDISPEEYPQIIVNNGDELTAGKIIEKFENRVIISGAIYKPGAYELTQNMQLIDLIKKAEGLREDAFLERGLIIREDIDLKKNHVSFDVVDIIDNNLNIFLHKEDSIYISSIFDIEEKETVEIKGLVKNPGKFNYAYGMTLQDIIFLAGGFLNNANIKKIEVARKLTLDEIQESAKDMIHKFEINVDKNLSFKNQEFKLNPFDRIFVHQAPGFEKFGSITISGAIESPGIYGILTLNDRISDILKRVGKIKKNANPEYAYIIRKRELTENEYDTKVRIALEQANLDSAVIQDIEKTESYNVGVNLKNILQRAGGEDDLMVQNNDELVVPLINLTVRIKGAVLNPTAISYNTAFTVKDYINMSGGFSLSAKKNKIYVVHPNGNSVATKSFIFNTYPKVSPGSKIIVLEKKKRDAETSFHKWVNISTTAATLASTILGIIVLTK